MKDLKSISKQKLHRDTARKLYPLVSLIHSADTLAASIMERSAEELDDM